MKIAVIGAGPAGSFCAYHLARGGADVTLFDRFAEAWEKPCGGGVPPKVRERFAEVAAFDGEKRPVEFGNFISPKGKAVRLQSRRPMWIFSRRVFDGHLRRIAVAAGAKFTTGVVKGVVKEGRQFRLDGPPAAGFDFIVGADGPRSVVRRALLQPIPDQLLSLTVGYFLEAREEEATSWFLPRPGYVWAFPRTDHLCLGGGSAERSLNIWEYVENVRTQRYPAVKILQKWAAAIPFIRDPGFFDQAIAGDGFALIGDAAGHVDALTGEGILYAMWGGEILARCLLADRPASFAEQWRDEFGGELAKSANLSGKFYDPKTLERVFALAVRSATMRRFLMDIMTDQPSYLSTGRMFLQRLPRIGWEFLRSLI